MKDSGTYTQSSESPGSRGLTLGSRCVARGAAGTRPSP